MHVFKGTITDAAPSVLYKFKQVSRYTTRNFIRKYCGGRVELFKTTRVRWNQYMRGVTLFLKFGGESSRHVTVQTIKTFIHKCFIMLTSLRTVHV